MPIYTKNNGVENAETKIRSLEPYFENKIYEYHYSGQPDSAERLQWVLNLWNSRVQDWHELDLPESVKPDGYCSCGECFGVRVSIGEWARKKLEAYGQAKNKLIWQFPTPEFEAKLDRLREAVLHFGQVEASRDEGEAA